MPRVSKKIRQQRSEMLKTAWAKRKSREHVDPELPTPPETDDDEMENDQNAKKIQVVKRRIGRPRRVAVNAKKRVRVSELAVVNATQEEGHNVDRESDHDNDDNDNLEDVHVAGTKDNNDHDNQESVYVAGIKENENDQDNQEDAEHVADINRNTDDDEDVVIIAEVKASPETLDKIKQRDIKRVLDEQDEIRQLCSYLSVEQRDKYGQHWLTAFPQGFIKKMVQQIKQVPQESNAMPRIAEFLLCDLIEQALACKSRIGEVGLVRFQDLARVGVETD